MKAVLRNMILSTLCLASIVLAAPHQSAVPAANPDLKSATCLLTDCPKRTQQAASRTSAFMHESAATLSW